MSRRRDELVWIRAHIRDRLKRVVEYHHRQGQAIDDGLVGSNSLISWNEEVLEQEFDELRRREE